MTEETEQDWRTAAERESDIAQAGSLREQARKGGLRFEVFLPSGLAEWVLDLVERGVFTDPSEAASTPISAVFSCGSLRRVFAAPGGDARQGAS